MIQLRDIESYLISENIEYETKGKITEVTKFCSLKKIEPSGLFYIAGNLMRDFSTSIILCDQDKENFEANNTFIILDTPQLVFYKLMNQYFPKQTHHIHSTAVISELADIGENVSIGAHSYIGKATISSGTVIKQNVVVHDGVHIGQNSVISASSVIGADGVAWIWDQETQERIVQPQIGGVNIGKNVYIGSNITIVRGSVNEDTLIGDGTMVSHGSQIGHGVTIGKDVHIANNVSIAGNAVLNDRAFLGAGAAIVPQVSIAKDAVVGAGAVISKSIEVEGITMIAMPARAIPSASTRLKGVPESLKGAK